MNSPASLTDHEIGSNGRRIDGDAVLQTIFAALAAVQADPWSARHHPRLIFGTVLLDPLRRQPA